MWGSHWWSTQRLCSACIASQGASCAGQWQFLEYFTRSRYIPDNKTLADVCSRAHLTEDG